MLRPASFCLCLLVAVAAARAEGPASKPTTKEAPESPVVTPLKRTRSMKILEKAPLYGFSEIEVDRYIKKLHADEPDMTKRLLHLARKNIGQPYEIYLLGEFPYETYDPDPMYCLSKSDCVTFVEHTYAMALSSDWASFFKTLQRLRYKDGKVGMLTRNHESVADWDPNNAWLFENITNSLGDGKLSVPLTLNWAPSKFFKQFGIGDELPDVHVVDVYIPKANIPSILKQLKEGDVVHIVRGDSKEQYVGHFGLVAFGPNGEVNMIHSAEPAVREQGLMDYIEKNPKTLGMKFLRPKSDAQKLADAQR
ncbi:MAG TPA: N-acetylmuramoyl-L-alanine amidase-like domain-containing protein [Tepidisphaeraceae bacterium]|jgi:hypothetical protein